jgi:hypothetical protein
MALKDKREKRKTKRWGRNRALKSDSINGIVDDFYTWA